MQSHSLVVDSRNDGHQRRNRIKGGNRFKIAEHNVEPRTLQRNQQKFKQGNAKKKVTMVPSTIPSMNPSIDPSPSPTKSPSTHPTQSPSFFPTRSPSFFPTRSPSSSPTNSPSISKQTSSLNGVTPTPTLLMTQIKNTNSEDLGLESETTITATNAPSAKVTEEQVINVKFSVLLLEENNEIKAQNVETNQDNGLVLNLLQTATISICENTDYKVIAINNPNRNLCDLIQSRRFLNSQNSFSSLSTNSNKRRTVTEEGIYATLSIDPLYSVDSAFDRPLLNNTFIGIILRVGVEEIGPWYTKMSEMSFGAETPLSMVQVTVQEVVDDSISSGSFLTNLKGQEDQDDPKVKSVAIFGKEQATFIPNFNGTQQISGVSSVENAEVMDIAPMHGLRLFGIILMLITIAMAYTLFFLGKRRKDERELIEEVEKAHSEKAESLRLSSEDAVTEMLDVGRRVHSDRKDKMDSYEDEEEDGEVLNPETWEVMIGNEQADINAYEHVVID